MNNTFLILITGSPGVGKTTIIKKIAHSLHQKSLNPDGFYTEEVRNESHERLGFDIVTFNGSRDILARSSDMNSPDQKLPKVGKYNVYINKFEILALPIFQNNSNCLIIDEIGKMELLSKKFENEIKNILPKLKSGNIKLIATIPNRQSIKLINDLKTLENSKIFDITKTNRNNIYEEIEKCCLEMFN